MLFSPVSWETIPNTKIELDQWEHVTCLKNVSLAYEGTRSGLKGYIVLGTNYNYGEDITSRGRVSSVYKKYFQILSISDFGFEIFRYLYST